MAKARELIAAKNYNDAILVLTQVVREEPDRQDEAQELISLIVKLRNQYNDEYANLINQLAKDGDVEAALQSIAKLEAIDKNPNKRTRDDINQAKRTARLIANNKRYKDIMARALALLEQKQYSSAMQVYLEGSTLARDMFDEADYGNIVANRVDLAWADLKAAVGLFAQAEVRMKALPSQGTAVLAGAGAGFDAMLASVRDLAALRRRAAVEAKLFQSQNDFITQNGRQEDFFLDFSYLFVHGPTEAKTPEGILGAFDRQWADVLTPWTDQIKKTVEARYTAAKTLVDQGKLADAGPAFEALRASARQGLDVATLWSQLAEIGAGRLDPDVKAALSRGLPLGLWMEHRLTLALQGLQAAKQNQPLNLQASDRPGIEAARDVARTLKQTYGGYSDVDALWSLQSASLTGAGFTLLDPSTFGNSWQTVWAGYRQRYLDSEATLVDRRGALDYGGLDDRFQTMQTTLADIREQVEGKVKYPLQASGRLTDLRPVQDALIRDVTSFVGLYEGETSDVKTQAVLRWPVRGRDLLGRLNDAQTLRGQLLATAQANYTQSLAVKKQGQDLIPRIEPLITAENFTQARAMLNDASTKYSQSLALQEDPAFRSESDAQVKSIFEEILKRENEVVVREVRGLITKGSQAYLEQQFNVAQQTLVAARKRWSDTNTDPNTEVEYWLKLTIYALSVTGGRELSPIDPLYNEVQQLLNFARRQLNLAQEKINGGQKAQGLDLMRDAKETITKILIPFPLNQEARLLNLTIQKVSDPENFPALFKQNLTASVAKVNTNNIKDITDAYNDLQDLDKLQPDTPEILAAIKQARINLGLDPKPIDPKALAQARALVAQAQRLVDGGTAAQLANAETLVRQALTLVPNLAAAGELVDRISLQRKSQVQTLNVSQRQEITAIADTFRDNRTNEALQQITVFEQKYPGIVNIPEVKELDRRIRAVN
jgi:hypothetical protein